jgi:hypothetical protein
MRKEIVLALMEDAERRARIFRETRAAEAAAEVQHHLKDKEEGCPDAT